MGVVPVGGSHVRLPQQIPWAVAMELLLTGQSITAERAREVGLVNAVVPGERLMEEAMAWAQRICENGPLAVRTAKEIAVRVLNNEPAFVLEKTMAERVFRSEDAKEGPRGVCGEAQAQFPRTLVICLSRSGNRYDAGS